jgi:hypothetical protein
MTEPDEALLSVRRYWATICDEDGFPDEAERYRRGENDQTLVNDADFYRAGQAASADRIKALEEAIRRLLAASEPVETYTHEVAVRLEEAVEHADALLKEPTHA